MFARYDLRPRTRGSRPAEARIPARTSVPPIAASPVDVNAVSKRRTQPGLGSLLRHFLVIAALCGVGYGYQRAQEFGAPVNMSRSGPFDPFAEWDQMAEAPGFQENISSAPSFNSGSPESPIPFPTEDGLPDHFANKTSTGEPRADLVGLSRKEISPKGQKSNSIWDEPAAGVPTSTVSESKSQTGFSLPAPDQKNTITQSPEKTPSSGFNPFGVLPSPTQTDQLTTTVTETASSVWRQFQMGSGENRVVCLVDSSLSQNPNDLSSLMSMFRQEWEQSGQDGSLTMLVARPDAQGQFTGFESQLAALKPDRVIQLQRGTGNRGLMKFSSAKESLDALSVTPNQFRVTQATSSEIFQDSQGRSLPSIIMELPVSFDVSQESNTQILSRMVRGDWSPQAGLPAESSFSQIKLPGMESNPLNDIVDLMKPRETVPDPIETLLPEPEMPRETGSTFSLPKPSTTSTSETPQYRTTEEYLVDIFGGNLSGQEVTDKTVTTPKQGSQLTTSLPEEGVRTRKAVGPVELLDPPPIFQSSLMPVVKKTRSTFYRLPTPPHLLDQAGK
ncbi:MAG: hypothetical protein KDA78_05240 [Planctomycetaceae bacterium]|nr:hypothetical protein [Planctomycetaceae bacterium]